MGLVGAGAHAVRHQQHLLPGGAEPLDEGHHLAGVVALTGVHLLLQHHARAHAHHIAALEEVQIDQRAHRVRLGAVHLEGEGVVRPGDQVLEPEAHRVLVGDPAAGDQGVGLRQEDLRDDPVDRVLEGAHGLGALEHGGVQVQRRQDRGDVVEQELLTAVGEGDAALVQEHVAVGEGAHRGAAAQQRAREGEHPMGERERVDDHAQAERVRGHDLEVRVVVLRAVLVRVHAQQREVHLAEAGVEGLDGALEHGRGTLVAGQRRADDRDPGAGHGRVSFGRV